MNKKIIWIIVILLIAIIIFTKVFSNNKDVEEFKPIDKNIGDEFTELSYPKKMFIVNYEIADVTGDGENDMVMLIGESESGNGISDSIINNMDIVVYDDINSKFINAGSSKLNGKNNKLLIGDFTGDQIPDVMVLNGDDDKNNMRIYTYDSGKIKEIWKDRNNKGLIFAGELLDGFKAHITNKKLNLDTILDLSDQKDNYINAGVYDNSGKLKNDKNKILNSGFTTVEIVKLNDRSGIRTTQKICGISINDVLDEIEVIWKYGDGNWQMVEVKGLKLGNLLY